MIPILMNLVVSTVTFAIGFFFLAVPEQATKLWGRRQLAETVHGPVYRLLYRATGVLLCLAGLLFAIESVWTIS